MMKKILLLVVLSLWSVNAWLAEYEYHADVDGMVCAFCAYSISKNITSLDGVDADSVDVNLAQGKLSFRSTQAVSEDRLRQLFTDSGFTVSHLRVDKRTEATPVSASEPRLELTFSARQLDNFSLLIEAIGSIAASSGSRLLISAPAAQEEGILRPLLMGRQQVIKLRYVPNESSTIQIHLFDAAGSLSMAIPTGS